MARMRLIKPGFFINDGLVKIEPLGRLLFAGLWCIADREGRLEDRPLKIKLQVLPNDNCDADKLLNDLAEGGFILRYEVEGERYIQVVNWKKHQNPHVNEVPSTIPAPNEHGTSTIQAPYLHDTSTVLAPELHGTNPACYLLLDTSNSISKGKTYVCSPSDYTEDFESFWQAYPRKLGKRAAFKNWNTQIRAGHMQSEMIRAAENYATACKGKDTQYIKHPSTFLGPSKPFEEFVDGVPFDARASPMTIQEKNRLLLQEEMRNG